MEIGKLTKTTKQADGSSKTEELSAEQCSLESRKLFEQRGKFEVVDAHEAAFALCAALDPTTPMPLLVAIAGFAEDDVLSNAATKNKKADPSVLLARQKAMLAKAAKEETK